MSFAPVHILAVPLAIVTFSLVPACSSSGGPEPEQLSVGGTYSTAVNITENTCGNTVSVSALPTGVVHNPGSSSLTLQHGVTHTGTITANGSFTTQPTVVNSGGVQSTLTITGQFNTTGFVADVTVGVQQTQLPNTCQYKVHWVGSKQGAPNVIP